MFLRSINLISRFAFLFALALGPLAASQHWIVVTTPHFEMYTTNSQKQAVKALEVFEQVRSFFLETSKSKQAPDGLVRIIAFSSEHEYKPYRPNSGAFAYYLQSRERDYIVMQDIQADHNEAALHEYTHLIVEHTKMKLPIWLNEGLADLYSSLEPRGKRAMVGRPLSSRPEAYAVNRWMDWNVLFSVDHQSPYYNQSDKMSIFYAQSWLLTHMLELSPAYQPKFNEFLAAVANGGDAPDAFRSVYGKSIAEVGKDAAAYVRQTSVQASLFDVTLSQSTLNARAAQTSDFQVELALDDLLASRRETSLEARRRLVGLAQQYEERCEPEESLGYLAWQENKLPEAKAHFSKAVEHGSTNTRMIYDLAQLEQSAGTPPDLVAALLEKALAIRPDYIDAKILLAEVETLRGHYRSALSILSTIKKINPDQAFRYFSASAFSRANLQDYEEAKKSADQALRYATLPEQRTQVERLMGHLDQVRNSRRTIQN